jgi:hypothetical protein
VLDKRGNSAIVDTKNSTKDAPTKGRRDKQLVHNQKFHKPLHVAGRFVVVCEVFAAAHRERKEK